MKIALFYFSGTGNTAKVIEKYKNCCEQQGHTVTATLIENSFDEKGKLKAEVMDMTKNADIVGLGYPIHAFNAPSIVLKFVKQLPKISVIKRAFVVNTSGEPLKINNISSLKLKHILRRRNLLVSNEYHYCMPYNIIFRHNDTMAYKMWRTAELSVPIDVYEILHGVPHKLDKVFLGNTIAWIMRCEHWGGRLNGRQYEVDDKCVHCQKCINECPTHNMTVVDGKFKFGKKCLMCMRCAHLCPKNAIKIGWFNKWKVNGAYTFDRPQTNETQRYRKMLVKAYAKYFADCEKRLNSHMGAKK